MASKEPVSGQGLYKKIRRFLSRNRTRTFIFPTRFGFSFGAMTLALFFLAVGYANNLVYIFVFFLISVAVTGTLITNRNVEGIEVIDFHYEPFFAEETGSVVVQIENQRSATSWSLESYFDKDPEKSLTDAVEGKSEEDIVVPVVGPYRGAYQLPRLIIKSTFPFGLLRAWKVFKQTPEILIYPALHGEKVFPASAAGQEDKQNVGVFREHRLYQNTDPMMRIDWRASARRQELLVKNYEGIEKQSLRFSWAQTETLKDSEKRLSQLALWIVEAERQGHEYSLEIANIKTGLDRGSTHYHECLETLALIIPESRKKGRS